MRVLREGRWKGKGGRGRCGEHGNESRRVTTTLNMKGEVIGWCGGCLQWNRHTLIGTWDMRQAQSSR